MNEPNAFDARAPIVSAQAGRGSRLGVGRRTPRHAGVGAAAGGRRDVHSHGVLGPRRTSRRRAKRVIYLHMLGAISQVDTFDYKPMLEKMHGQELAGLGPWHRTAVDDGRRASRRFRSSARSPSSSQRGKSGRWISDLLPFTRGDRGRPLLHQDDEHRARQPRPGVEVPAHRVSDRGAAVRRRVGELRARLGQPGSADVRRDELGHRRRACRSTRRPGAPGFLPSHHQGVLFRSGDDPVPVRQQSRRSRP